MSYKIISNYVHHLCFNIIYQINLIVLCKIKEMRSRTQASSHKYQDQSDISNKAEACPPSFGQICKVHSLQMLTYTSLHFDPKFAQVESKLSNALVIQTQLPGLRAIYGQTPLSSSIQASRQIEVQLLNDDLGFTRKNSTKDVHIIIVAQLTSLKIYMKITLSINVSIIFRC